MQGVALTSGVVQLNCTRAIGPFRLILDLLLPFCASHTETIGASRDLSKGAMTPSGPRHMPETRRYWVRSPNQFQTMSGSNKCSTGAGRYAYSTLLSGPEQRYSGVMDVHGCIIASRRQSGLTAV
jgi:hypothetical protein